jgi:rubredoxin
MKRGFAKIRALAAEIAALQAKARALGVFADDRELLECPVCGLMENVAASGFLFTCRPESLDEDTGLRFEELSRDRFRCPDCGATVREANSTNAAATTKGGKRPCRVGNRRN